MTPRRWEYATYLWPDLVTASQGMAEAGREGWEIVSFLWDKDKHVAIFKRPLPWPAEISGQAAAEREPRS